MLKFAKTCILTALAFSLIEQPVFAQYWGNTVNGTFNTFFWPISAAIGGNRSGGYRGYGYGLNGALMAGSIISSAGYALNTIPRMHYAKQQQKDYQSYNDYLREKQVRANLYTNGYAGVPGAYPGVPSRFSGVPTAAGPPVSYAGVPVSYPGNNPEVSVRQTKAAKKSKSKKTNDVLPVATPGQNAPLSMYPQIGPKPVQVAVAPVATPGSIAMASTSMAPIATPMAAASTPLATGFVDAVNNNFGGNISQALFDPEMRSWAKSIGLIKASDDLVDTNFGGERVALIKSILADSSETPAAKLETVRLLLKH